MLNRERKALRMWGIGAALLAIFAVIAFGKNVWDAVKGWVG